MSTNAPRTLEDVINDASAAAARQREAQKNARRNEQREQDRGQIERGAVVLTEIRTIDRAIAELKRLPGWESTPDLTARVEELEALRAANTEEIEALGDKADIAQFNLAVAAFGDWVKIEGDADNKSSFEPLIHDIRAYSPALHRLLDTTQFEIIDEGEFDAAARVAQLLGEITSQIELLTGKNKNREVPSNLLEAQKQLAALDPSTLASEMELFNSVPYLSNQLMRCMCPLKKDNEVTHSVTQNGRVVTFRGRQFRFKGFVRSSALRSATLRVRKTAKHCAEINSQKREEMDAHRSAWEAKNPHFQLTSITQVTKDKRQGMFYGDVEVDFGPRDNRRTAKGTVVIESDDEGITVLAASGPIAGRLITDFDKDDPDRPRVTFIGTQLAHGKLPKTLWFMRDISSTGEATPTTYVSADPDVDTSLASKFTSPDKPSGKDRSRESGRRDKQRRNSDGLERVRRGSRRGQADED